MDYENFALPFMERLMEGALGRLALTELPGHRGGPRLTLGSPASEGGSTGYVRLWQGNAGARIDRMTQVRLQSAAADTHLLFIFGREETPMPHFHAQVVQFAADACVYNADLLPRLDPVDHPDYYREVFGPLTKAFWTATQIQENVCAQVAANPALAVYLSPWGIAAGRPTNRAELERVGPQIHAYLEHYLALAARLEDRQADPVMLRARHHRHLELFMSEDLDPRAWKGVRRIVGDAATEELRAILRESLINNS
jgi:hypothetical protein